MVSSDKRWGINPDIGKSLMLSQREVAVFVCDAVNLEGISFTLPEIQTLMEGITVGGHKLNDQQIAINQGRGWDYIFTSIKQRSFSLSKQYACKLHAVAGQEEALEWGVFRSGGVTIAGTDYMPPESAKFNGLFILIPNKIPMWFGMKHSFRSPKAINYIYISICSSKRQLFICIVYYIR